MAEITSREDKIKKPDGTTITRSGIVSESINFYKQAYQDNITDICDFSDGSEIRTLHESFAVEVFSLYRETITQAKLKFVKYAKGIYLDELACEYHLSRKKSEVSSGTVTFTTSATINSNIVIPKGTVILARDTGYEYVLSADVMITATDTPVNGIVYSRLAGAKYNAPIGKLTAFANIGAINTQVKVTNNTEISGGVDEENDEDFRSRILSAKREKAHGTVPAYKDIVVGDINDVHDIAFVEPETLLKASKYARHYKEGINIEDTYQRWTGSGNIRYDSVTKQPIVKTLEQLIEDDLLCTECNAVLFVNSFSKPCSDKTIEDVEYVMTQQNNLVVGQKFHIEKAQCVSVYLSLEIFATASISEETIVEFLKAYFDGGTVEGKIGKMTFHGLDIQEPIYKSRLIDVLEYIPGVYQVGSIKQMKYNKSIPTEIEKWNNNGKAGWSYEDDLGYLYYRPREDANTIEYWGKRNFISLETHEGSVFKLGMQKNLDDSLQSDVDITLVLVDENGNVTKEG